MNLISLVEKERHHVVVDSYTPNWNELLGQYKNHDVKINPEYQRAFRWSNEQQTKYIESILLNIPTPPIFLAEKSNGSFEVIDGLQRFSTLLKFFSAEIFDREEDLDPQVIVELKDGDDVNNIRVPSVLTSAPILTDLEGITRETLPETLVRTLRYSRVQVIILKKESSELARYNVFSRLNRAGTALSNQEIRNCSARIFNPVFADALIKIAQNPSVKKAMGLSVKKFSSMGAQENILRLIAFCYFSPETKSIEEFLDQVMYKVSSGDFKFTDKIKNNIVDLFSILADAFPEGESFKFMRDGKFKGEFSPNLFDIVACGVYKNLNKYKNKPPALLRERLVSLQAETEVKLLTGAGSNTKAKMLGRVKFGKKWFE